MIISSFCRNMALQSAVLCSFIVVIIGGQRIPTAEPQQSRNLLSPEQVMHVRISQSVPRHLCRRAIRNTQVLLLSLIFICPYKQKIYIEHLTCWPVKVLL